ncbi:sn-glycerol-3-phosphate import ATP-binding protein UgpC [Candidatus Thermoflexus japonica]|uniref:sn-glycerol-3-phosphate import ATP-binding protein UgpC n=1 Tax=Candidatus Thermoflexus japonica TaxID=2035417 RepID=A0A2H5Y8B6_9CHLR|nr:sn-glycerol-3-phosphate import ATP-binding protein UgpC [Candidatus Thermoflexus japonica]
MAGVRLEGVRKTFGKVVALREISLTVEDGEFFVLLGPSGCGKTTLLRCIAGLERVDRGRIFIGNREVTGLPPRRRNIAMVFQSYAVFPHMKVYDNIAFGLRMRRVPEAEVRRRVERAAGMLQLEGLLDRYPAQLSGGQRQRVAVARALVMQPEVLLMDEPLSNLDALLRLHARAELKRLHQETGMTIIYVTHDQVEAMSLGDRIAVMREGEIVQVDAPMRIYEAPATVFVGGFIGNPPMNFLQGVVEDGEGGPVFHLEGHRIPLSLAGEVSSGQQLLLGIRAEHIRVNDESHPGALPAEVLVVEPLGAQLLITARIGTQTLKLSLPPGHPVAPGQLLWLSFPAEAIRWMDARSGRAIPASAPGSS